MENLTFNPFPGLRPFEITESYLFFGREEQVDELAGRLAENRFLAVLGTSGSGKSSLVRAGLFPLLYGGFMGETGPDWKIAIMRPGDGPLKNLAVSLFDHHIFGEQSETDPMLMRDFGQAILSSSSLGLVQVARENLKSGENLLLLVDQFEELFRYRKTDEDGAAADEAQAFVKLLLEAARQRDVPIYVLITLRSDFLGDCARFHNLPEAINRGQYLVPRLTRDQMKSTITGPVSVGGALISPRLVQQLLNDVGDNQDQLPILQHALMRTWEKWSERGQIDQPLDIDAYFNIGGMRKALNNHAEEAYAELDEKQRILTEKIFKTITTRGNDNREVRRPTQLAKLAKVCEAETADVISVINHFRRAGRGFLMPPDNIHIEPASIIDISHESLIRIWERLGRWVNEEAESAKLYMRMAESAALYHAGSAGLWRDPELQLAVDWREKQQPTKEWAGQYKGDFNQTIAFLEISQRFKQKQLRDKALTRRILQAAAVLLLIGLSSLTLWALRERGKAVKSQLAAMEQQKVAENEKLRADSSRTEAEQSALRAEQERQTALEQKEKAEQSEREANRQKEIAQKAENKSREAQRTALREKEQAIKQKSISDSLRVVADESAELAKRQRMQDLAQSLAGRSILIRDKNEAELKALLALQAYELNANYEGETANPIIYKAMNDALKLKMGDNAFTLQKHKDAVRGLYSLKAGATMLSAGNDGQIIEWSVVKENKEGKLMLEAGTNLKSLASNGEMMATGGDDRTIRLWSLKDKTRVAQLNHHTGNITGLAFQGENLFSISFDNTLQSYNISNKATAVLDTFGSRPLALAALSGIVWVALENGDIRKIDLWQKQNIAKIPEKVSSMTVSADGNTLAVGCRSGNLYLLNAGNGAVLRRVNAHQSNVTSLAFGSKGQSLASASLDGSLKVWNLRRDDVAPVIFNDHESWIWCVAYDSGNDLYYSGGRDKTIRFYDLDYNRNYKQLKGLVKRELSPQEKMQYMGMGKQND